MRGVGRWMLVAAGLQVCLTPPQAQAWGAMHGSITQSALSVLPEWEQKLLAAQSRGLIDLYCMIPDLAQAPVHKKDFTRYVVLPNGDLFCHLPFKTRDKTAYQIQYYFNRVVETLREDDLEQAARWAGCLLHYLEDSGSPAHTMPGDNQMGLMQDLLQVPEAFKNRAMHGLIEEGKLWVNISGYKPQLLGTTVEEGVFNLIERYNAMVRNARAQVIPILQGVHAGDQEAINAGQMRAARMDAEVVADALHTMLCVAKERFEPEEVALLAARDVSTLRATEVIHQSYFPQHVYFSDPYFGSPVKGGVLAQGKERQSLALTVLKDGKPAEQEFEKGLGLGTGFRMTYALPNLVYDQFECTLGLHATLGVEGKAAFRVLADGKDIFRSEELTGASPAQKVTLPVWGVKELTIITEGRSAVKGHNYAIIAEPTLRKATDAVKLKESRAVALEAPKIPVQEMPVILNKLKTE